MGSNVINGGGFMENECIKIGSVTYANKAREILKSRGISSKTKKSISANDGCAYFIEIDKRNYEQAVVAFEAGGLRFERCDLG